MNRKHSPHIGIKYIPHFIFVSLLGIVYIANTYFAEKKINEINELQNDIESLRIKYNTLKYHHTQITSYDSIKKEAQRIGLIENDSQLISIKVTEEK